MLVHYPHCNIQKRSIFPKILRYYSPTKSKFCYQISIHQIQQSDIRWYGVSSSNDSIPRPSSNKPSASGMTSRCGWRIHSIPIQIRASPCSIHGTAKFASNLLFFSSKWSLIYIFLVSMTFWSSMLNSAEDSLFVKTCKCFINSFSCPLAVSSSFCCKHVPKSS